SEADYIKVAYHAPGFGSEDVYGLMMLDAILSGVRLFAFGPGQSSGRSARLHKALVERKLATEASSEFWPTIDPSVFALDVTVWEGVSIDRAERVLMEEIEKIRGLLLASMSLRGRSRRSRLSMRIRLTESPDKAS